MTDLMENHYEQICQIQEIFNVNNFNISYFSLDTWYVLEEGWDKDGCGRTPGSACSTLLYLLQQVNRTHLPPSMATQVPPSKEMDPDNRTQVSSFMDNHPDKGTQAPPSMDIDPNNRTRLPPPTRIDPDNQTHVLDIITDKDLNIDQQTAVSTLFFIITSNHHQMWLLY